MLLICCGGIYAFGWTQPQVPHYRYSLWSVASLACGAAAAQLLEWKGAARAGALAVAGLLLAAGGSRFGAAFALLGVGILASARWRERPAFAAGLRLAGDVGLAVLAAGVGAFAAVGPGAARPDCPS